MGATLDGRKYSLSNLILEGRDNTLFELFDSKPFKSTFVIEPGYDSTYEIEDFKDTKGNKVSISFNEEVEDVFSVEFTVNGTSFKAEDVDYSVRDYSRLLSTVAKAVSQFLEEKEPYGLIFRGADDFKSISKNPKKEGQKDRIYNFFISQLKNNNNYKIGDYPDGIGLQRK